LISVYDAYERIATPTISLIMSSIVSISDIVE
jgi:hypothetical protein